MVHSVLGAGVGIEFPRHFLGSKTGGLEEAVNDSAFWEAGSVYRVFRTKLLAGQRVGGYRRDVRIGVGVEAISTLW